MRLLLDANLSPEVARLLESAGYDAIHVADVGLLSAADLEILQAAAKEDQVLLTADTDFGALLAAPIAVDRLLPNMPSAVGRAASSWASQVQVRQARRAELLSKYLRIYRNH